MDESDVQEILMNVFQTLFEARKEINDEPDVCTLADMTIDMAEEIGDIVGVAPFPYENNAAKMSIRTNRGPHFYVTITKA